MTIFNVNDYILRSTLIFVSPKRGLIRTKKIIFYVTIKILTLVLLSTISSDPTVRKPKNI